MNKSIRIDFLKTISIFLVCYFHYGHYIVDSTDMSFTGVVKILLRLLATTAVPIFFCINGYLSLEKNYSIEQILGKAKQLLGKLMFWIPITAFVYAFLSEGRILSVGELLNRSWNWQGNGVQHLWFLFTLLVLYLIYPFVNLIYRSKNKKIKVFYFAMLFLFTFGNAALNLGANIINYYLNNPQPLYTDKNFFNGPNFFYGWYAWTLVYYVLGTKLFSVVKTPKTRILLGGGSVWLGGIVYIWACYTMAKYTSDAKHYLYFGGYNQVFVLLVVVGIILLSELLQFPKWTHRILNIAGRNTLGVLFFHRIWGEIFLKFFNQYGISIRDSGVWAGLLGATLVFTCSLLCTVLLKKTKVGKVLL